MSFSFMYGSGMGGNVNVNEYCDNNGPPPPMPPMAGPVPGISYHHLPPAATSMPSSSSVNPSLHTVGLHADAQGSGSRLSLPPPHDQDLYKGNPSLHSVSQGLPLRITLPPSTNQDLTEGYHYQPDPVIRQKPETENRPEKRVKKQRKRRPAGTAISRTELKRRRNAGEEYVTRKGKIIHKKEYEPIECKCRLNCSNKVSHDVRRLIFQQFHGLADWNNQTQFIVSSVTVLDVKGRRKKAAKAEESTLASSSTSSSSNNNNADHRRTASRIFYLTNKKIRVCKPVFLSTLGITNKRLDYALRHKAVPMTALATPDMRGKKGPQNKTPQEVEDNIRTHIQSFPKPANTPAKASKPQPSASSPSELTISKMYALYQEQCRAHGLTPASMWVYAKIYHSEFKLTPGGLSKKDAPCKTCERTRIILRSREDPEKIIQMLLKEHQEGMAQDMGSYSSCS